MKWIKTLLFMVAPLCLLLASTSFAHDTDLYMASGQGVEANLLIMFDNSGSMNDQIQAYFYDPSTIYDPVVVPQSNRNKVYYRVTGASWNVFANSITDVACPSAQTALTI